MLRPLLLGALCVTLVASGCAGRRGSSTPAALRGLPPRTDPPIDLTGDDDLARAHAEFVALPLDAPDRTARRRALWRAYEARVTRTLKTARDEAFAAFQRGIELWHARELDDHKAPPADLGLVVATADSLYTRFSRTGNDLEAVTALAVLRAARPDRVKELDQDWRDIVAYTDDLAVAEAGPGAERSRAIVMLESVVERFASRWVVDELVRFYLERQKVVTTAIKKGKNEKIQGAQRDLGVVRPIWNLVRAHALAYRLPEAPNVVDKLKGDFGDDPDMRRRLREALAKDADGKRWLGLAGYYVPDETQKGGHSETAFAICAFGSERVPDAVEPKKCAAELARVRRSLPLALRYAEAGRRIAPDDRDLGEILARIHVMQLNDLIVAERLRAAGTKMKAIEAFYTDANRRFAKAPLEVTLADAYLTLGHGLLNQGELPSARAYLEKARVLEPKSPRPVEQLATIAMKTGDYEKAARAFETASAMPRDTPLEASFEGARLRRLAGEAWARAGEEKKAAALWRRTLDEWKQILAANLNEGARAQAYTEIGRLYYGLGLTREALRAFEAAVDSNPEEAGTYGDVIAFLTTRGHYPAALDAYHRALARPEVTEYLKIYTSLWIIDLARLRGVEADSRALDYLASVSRGRKWYHRLAAFKVGKLSFERLLAEADTRGKRAEAFFYEAMNRFARRERGGAERLLRDVVSTQMLGFYEYDMATYFLDHGPPGRAASAKRR